MPPNKRTDINHKANFKKKDSVSDKIDKNDMIRLGVNILKGKSSETTISTRILLLQSLASKFIMPLSQDKEITVSKNFPNTNRFINHYRSNYRHFRNNDLFGGTRGRLKDNKKRQTTCHLGVVDGKDDQISDSDCEPHTRFSCIRDESSQNSFLSESNFYGLPFIAGPSGCMSELMAFAHTLKVFTNSDTHNHKFRSEILKQFVLACVGHLVCAGAHSFHEVMVVASALSPDLLGYQPGIYESAFPESFQPDMTNEKLTYKPRRYL